MSFLPRLARGVLNNVDEALFMLPLREVIHTVRMVRTASKQVVDCVYFAQSQSDAGC